MKTRLVSFIGTRVSKDTRTKFVQKARKAEGMDQSDVLRELIHAYIENRITITPSDPKGLNHVK